MAFATRNEIADALFSQVLAAVDAVLGIQSSGQKLVLPEEIDQYQLPALFQTQVDEDFEHQGLRLPAKMWQHFEIALYLGAAQEQSEVPVRAMNDALDAIDAALRSSINDSEGGTLGGLCRQVWISGKAVYFEGLTVDGRSVLVVPIAVMRAA